MQLDIGELAADHRRIIIDPASDECRSALREAADVAALDLIDARAATEQLVAASSPPFFDPRVFGQGDADDDARVDDDTTPAHDAGCRRGNYRRTTSASRSTTP